MNQASFPAGAALVFGGSGGIGQEVAKSFGRAGSDVAIVYREAIPARRFATWELAYAGPSTFAGRGCNPFFFTTSYNNDQVHAVMGQVAQDEGVSTIWSWGWANFGPQSVDPDKPAAACVYLWSRDQTLCDGPGAAVLLRDLGEPPGRLSQEIRVRYAGATLALTRLDNFGVPSLRSALAGMLGIDYEALLPDRGGMFVRMHGRFGLVPENQDLRAVFLSAGIEYRLDRSSWKWGRND